MRGWNTLIVAASAAAALVVGLSAQASDKGISDRQPLQAEAVLQAFGKGSLAAGEPHGG